MANGYNLPDERYELWCKTKDQDKPPAEDEETCASDGESEEPSCPAKADQAPPIFPLAKSTADAGVITKETASIFQCQPYPPGKYQVQQAEPAA